MKTLSEQAQELVNEAEADRMNSETPANSWCAKFQDFVPLLIQKIAQLEKELDDTFPKTLEEEKEELDGLVSETEEELDEYRTLR